MAFAAAGALAGILGFARVLEPMALEDTDLGAFEMSRVPSLDRYGDFTTLTNKIRQYAGAEADARRRAGLAQVKAKAADGLALRAEAVAIEKEAASAARPKAESLKPPAAAARALADRRRKEADGVASDAAALVETADQWQRQLQARTRLREDVYKLGATDKVKRRFVEACVVAGLAVALVGAGVVLLALAPNPKSEGAPAAALVTLTLNETGQDAIGCEVASLQGVRVGGDDETPQVITFPSDDCPSKSVLFRVQPPEPMGSLAPATPIEAPSGE